MTMNGDISSHDLARIKNSMFLGLARQPLAVPGPLQALLSVVPREPTLTVLALAGQRQRFQRPSVEHRSDGIPEAARRLHEDPRPLIPVSARRILLRLANGVDKTLADAVIRAAVRRVMRAGFRLHPFDLPRLIAHIREHARCLGLAERAYLALAEADVPGKADTPGLLHVEITTENWTEFPKGHRVAFLRAERRKDPAAARALLEAVFNSEPAAVRADLLAALDVGLGADDLPFLEGLAADRAESVRGVASRLTASVRCTSAYAVRLAEAARCFARNDSSVSSSVSALLKFVGLTNPANAIFTPPKRASQTEQRAALVSLFEGFSVTEIAAATSLAVSDVIGALPVDEETVLTIFSNRAILDGDEETMVLLVAHRLSHIESLRFSVGPVLAWLGENLTHPLSAESGNAVLWSVAWQATLQRFKGATTPVAMKDDGTLVWTAAVLPAELLPSFQEMLAPLLATTTRSARDFAELVLTLETT
jgi:hypothetical protein